MRAVPFLLASALALPAQEAADVDLGRAIKSARDRVFPTLVHIVPVSNATRAGRTVETLTSGSGVIVSPDGLVVTNYHVAGTAKRVTCTLSDRRRCPATVVGADAATDLALLRLDLATLGVDEAPAAELGSTSGLEAGDVVMAMGSPLGLSRSLSLGVVSCMDRHLAGLVLRGNLPTGAFNTWIQTDAAINPGNSGGPLVDLRGTVVGINSRGYHNADNLGFAIPVEVVRDVVERLRRDGRVVRSRIGLICQPLEDPAKGRGLRIASVEPDSAADRAGLRAGDVMVAYDGVPIGAAFDEEMPTAMRRMADVPVGKRIDVAVVRGGAEIELEVVTEEWEPADAEETELAQWGMTARALSAEERRERFLDAGDAASGAAGSGVLITGVRVGGAAALARPALVAGDVVLAVGDAPVAAPEEMAEALNAAAETAPAGAFLLLRVRRGDATWLVALGAGE
jgi:serine protease Do